MLLLLIVIVAAVFLSSAFSDGAMNMDIISDVVGGIAAVWVIVLMVFSAGAMFSDANDGLVDHEISKSQEQVLRAAESELADSDGNPDDHALALSAFRESCVEIRRAHAIEAYMLSADAVIAKSDVPYEVGADITDSLDAYDLGVELHPWNLFRTSEILRPDLSPGADNAHSRLADAVLSGDPELVAETVSRDGYPALGLGGYVGELRVRALREIAIGAIEDLTSRTFVLDGAPDPDGLCPVPALT